MDTVAQTEVKKEDKSDKEMIKILQDKLTFLEQQFNKKLFDLEAKMAEMDKKYNNEINNNIAILTYETLKENEEIQVINYNNNRIKDKIVLIDLKENKKINDCIYLFKNKGKQEIMMIIINKIDDFSKMFKNCSRLIGIRGNIDVSNGKDFSEMFYLYVFWM